MSKLQQPQEVIEYNKAMNELEEIVRARQKLMTQKHENQMVKTELELVEDDDIVYKYEDGELQEEDILESEICVDQRLEYLDSELKKLDSKEDDLRNKIKELQKKIAVLRKAQQAQAQQAQANK
ncbi:Prefoldin subunit 6 [Entamoeba marina]